MTLNYFLNTFLVVLAITFNVNCLKLENFKQPEALIQTRQDTQNFQSFNKLDQTPNSHAPRCGQIYNKYNDRIYYKPFQSVQSDERCFWIIEVFGALGYTFDIEYLGFPTNIPDSGQELVITQIGRGPTMSSILPKSEGFFNTTGTNLVIVTFYSPTFNTTRIPSRGFALQYRAIFENDNFTKLEPTHTNHQFLQSPIIDFKYPVSGNYSNLELTAFLFLPSGNRFNAVNNHIWYKRSGLENCHDSLYFYNFNINGFSSAAGIWSPAGKICNDVTTIHFQHNDSILMIFQSDQSVVSTGFSLSFVEIK